MSTKRQSLPKKPTRWIPERYRVDHEKKSPHRKKKHCQSRQCWEKKKTCLPKRCNPQKKCFQSENIQIPDEKSETIRETQQISPTNSVASNYMIKSFYNQLGDEPTDEIITHFDKRIQKCFKYSREIFETIEDYASEIENLPWKFDTRKFKVYDDKLVYSTKPPAVAKFGYTLIKYKTTSFENIQELELISRLLNRTLFNKQSQNFFISLVNLIGFNSMDLVIVSEFSDTHPIHNDFSLLSDHDATSFILQTLLALSTLHVKYGIVHGFIDRQAFNFREVVPGDYFAYHNFGETVYVKNRGFVVILSQLENATILKPKRAIHNYYGERNCMIQNDSLIPLMNKNASPEDFIEWNSALGTRNFIYKDSNAKFDFPVDWNDTDRNPAMEFFTDIQNVFAVLLGNPSTLSFRSKNYNKKGAGLSTRVREQIIERGVVSSFPYTTDSAKYLSASLMIRKFAPRDEKPIIDEFYE